MPQMKPMNWLFLWIYFLIIFSMYIPYVYFMFKQINFMNFNKIMNKNSQLKLMW